MKGIALKTSLVTTFLLLSFFSFFSFFSAFVFFDYMTRSECSWSCAEIGETATYSRED